MEAAYTEAPLKAFERHLFRPIFIVDRFNGSLAATLAQTPSSTVSPVDVWVVLLLHI